MNLIAGLGNPGDSHCGNRHNIGFMAVDEIARRHDFGPWRKKFKAEICEGRLDGQKALLIKPQAFVNRSGEAVGEAMRFYKLPVENLIVIYDELDLPPGKLRVRSGGGSGGHNGVRSIDAHCGNAFRRVRMGIGHPGDKAKVRHYVLSDFSKSDKNWLDPFLQVVAENIPLLVEGKESTFMNRVSLASHPDAVAQRPKAKKGDGHKKETPVSAAQETAQTGPMAAFLQRLFGVGER